MMGVFPCIIGRAVGGDRNEEAPRPENPIALGHDRKQPLPLDMLKHMRAENRVHAGRLKRIRHARQVMHHVGLNTGIEVQIDAARLVILRAADVQHARAQIRPK